MSRRVQVAGVVALGMLGAVVVASAASAGGGCHAGVTEGGGTTVEMVDACFTPTVLSIEPGQTVTWINRSGIVHNVTANLWGHFEDVPDGDTVRMRFDDEGTYPYACTYHPGMSGVVVVGDGDGPGNGSEAFVTPIDASSADGKPDADATVAAAAPANEAAEWIVPGAVGAIAGSILGLAIGSGRRRIAPGIREVHEPAG